jgi:sec-independent protein translocase protein TatA
MGSFGWSEMFWIILVILILFGAKRIPEMMRSMGQGVKEFKKAARDISEDTDSSPPKTPPAAAPNSTDKPV